MLAKRRVNHPQKSSNVHFRGKIRKEKNTAPQMEASIAISSRSHLEEGLTGNATNQTTTSPKSIRNEYRQNLSESKAKPSLVNLNLLPELQHSFNTP